jgi:transcriptional regulator with XRE-family HTH domain
MMIPATADAAQRAFMKLRLEKGLTRTQAASLMEMDSSALTQFENGVARGQRVAPRLATLVKYFDALGYDLSLAITPKP